MFKIKGLSFVLVFFVALGFLNLAVADTVDVTGYWQGTWNSYYSDTGGLSIDITQSGTSLSGNLTITNTECGTFSNLNLSGSVSGNIITVYTSAYCPLDGSDNELGFTNGAVNGNSIFGYYSVYSDGYPWDYGEFSLTRAINIITASAGAGGSISPSGKVSVPANSSQTFQIVPDDGYRVLEVIVDGSSVGRNTSYTFTNVSSNHTITVTFTPSPQASPGLPLLLLDE